MSVICDLVELLLSYGILTYDGFYWGNLHVHYTCIYGDLELQFIHRYSAALFLQSILNMYFLCIVVVFGRICTCTTLKTAVFL